jgi:hypothetical protein
MQFRSAPWRQETRRPPTAGATALASQTREAALPDTQIDYTPEAEHIAKEFPGWKAWASLRGGQWHARLNDDNGNALVLLHDDNPQGIREQIRGFSRR